MKSLKRELNTFKETGHIKMRDIMIEPLDSILCHFRLFKYRYKRERDVS